MCCRRVALLAGADVLALFVFATIGRYSHGLSVLDLETLRTADPFIAGLCVWIFFCFFVFFVLFMIVEFVFWRVWGLKIGCVFNGVHGGFWVLSSLFFCFCSWLWNLCFGESEAWKLGVFSMVCRVVLKICMNCIKLLNLLDSYFLNGIFLLWKSVITFWWGMTINILFWE